ncbi:PH domain-containing protein [Kineococcus sp. SYSU DK003]|uniref:PH domain-containing protein n=1 Tax=Kineococcus sp. SYSU DK003 TaxID=3383124 RepID=UPI003D7E017F
MDDEATPTGNRAAPELLIDLAGLQRIYQQTYQGRSRVWPLVMAGLAILFAVPRIISGHWFDKILGLVVLTSIAITLIMHFWRPPATVVDEHGLRIRKVLIDGHLIPWSEVEQVCVQGRWENYSTVVTQGGRKVSLVGVPREAAQRLAEALQQAQTP